MEANRLRHPALLASDGVRQGGIVDTHTAEWCGIFFHERRPSGRIPQLQPVTGVAGWLGADWFACEE